MATILENSFKVIDKMKSRDNKFESAERYRHNQKVSNLNSAYNNAIKFFEKLLNDYYTQDIVDKYMDRIRSEEEKISVKDLTVGFRPKFFEELSELHQIVINLQNNPFSTANIKAFDDFISNQESIARSELLKGIGFALLAVFCIVAIVSAFYFAGPLVLGILTAASSANVVTPIIATLSFLVGIILSCVGTVLFGIDSKINISNSSDHRFFSSTFEDLTNKLQKSSPNSSL